MHIIKNSKGLRTLLSLKLLFNIFFSMKVAWVINMGKNCFVFIFKLIFFYIVVTIYKPSVFTNLSIFWLFLFSFIFTDLKFLFFSTHKTYGALRNLR